jgi:biotin-(acetyl-CoA carboxylase) ligase
MDGVVGDVLLALTSLLSDWPASGFLGWREVWQRRDFLAGHEVAVQHNGEALVGLALGVDSTGALSVHTDRGVVSVHAGEASMLRRVPL